MTEMQVLFDVDLKKEEYICETSNGNHSLPQIQEISERSRIRGRRKATWTASLPENSHWLTELKAETGQTKEPGTDCKLEINITEKHDITFLLRPQNNKIINIPSDYGVVGVFKNGEKIRTCAETVCWGHLILSSFFFPVRNEGGNKRNAVVMRRRLLRRWLERMMAATKNTFLPLLWARIDEDGERARCREIKTRQKKRLQEMCRQTGQKKKRFSFMCEMFLNVETHGGQTSPTSYKNMKWQEDGCRWRKDDAASCSHVSQCLWLQSGDPLISSGKRSKCLGGFLTWQQTAVLSLQRQLLTGRAHAHTASLRSAVAGRTGALRGGAPSRNATSLLTESHLLSCK